MKVTFAVIRERAKKAGVCRECGKRCTRSKTFEQTVNPWNKNKDGSPKTPDEIRAELRVTVKTWIGEAIICASCEG
jgi:hypothetical protein